MVFSKITLHGGTHCQTLAATFDHPSLFFSSPGCVSSSSFFSFSFHTRWLLLLPSDLGFFFFSFFFHWVRWSDFFFFFFFHWVWWYDLGFFFSLGSVIMKRKKKKNCTYWQVWDPQTVWKILSDDKWMIVPNR